MIIKKIKKKDCNFISFINFIDILLLQIIKY